MKGLSVQEILEGKGSPSDRVDHPPYLSPGVIVRHRPGPLPWFDIKTDLISHSITIQVEQGFPRRVLEEVADALNKAGLIGRPMNDTTLGMVKGVISRVFMNLVAEKRLERDFSGNWVLVF